MGGNPKPQSDSKKHVQPTRPWRPSGETSHFTGEEPGARQGRYLLKVTR